MFSLNLNIGVDIAYPFPLNRKKITNDFEMHRCDFHRRILPHLVLTGPRMSSISTERPSLAKFKET